MKKVLIVPLVRLIASGLAIAQTDRFQRSSDSIICAIVRRSLAGRAIRNANKTNAGKSNCTVIQDKGRAEYLYLFATSVRGPGQLSGVW